MAASDLFAGYNPQLDYPLPGRPEAAEMRESVSMWFFDDRGRVGFPRFCIEALASQWDDRGVQANIALDDGRVLRCAGGFAAGEPRCVDDRPVSLDAGPLRRRVDLGDEARRLQPHDGQGDAGGRDEHRGPDQRQLGAVTHLGAPRGEGRGRGPEHRVQPAVQCADRADGAE